MQEWLLIYNDRLYVILTIQIIAAASEQFKSASDPEYFLDKYPIW